jgi:hypothetical protein
MLLVSNAEQGTIEQIAEQRINKTLADTKSWTILRNTKTWQNAIMKERINEQVRQIDNNYTQKWMSWYENFVWLNPVMTEIGRYLLEKSNWDYIMVATFIAESWLNPYSVSSTSDHGLCQLNRNKTNNPIIDDERFLSDWKWQADFCVSKWSVANHNLWYAYKNWAYKKYLSLFKN